MDRAEARRWWRFVIRSVGTAVAACVALLALALALDPYDTGFGLVGFPGTTWTGPRLGDASRVHDDRFDSALFGNSHVMSLSPARLSNRTGRRFVMLAVPGTGVPGQMTMLDSYLARHTPPRTVVFGIDPCTAPPIRARCRRRPSPTGSTRRTAWPMRPACSGRAR